MHCTLSVALYAALYCLLWRDFPQMKQQETYPFPQVLFFQRLFLLQLCCYGLEEPILFADMFIFP